MAALLRTKLKIIRGPEMDQFAQIVKFNLYKTYFSVCVVMLIFNFP